MPRVTIKVENDPGSILLHAPITVDVAVDQQSFLDLMDDEGYCGADPEAFAERFLLPAAHAISNTFSAGRISDR